MPDSRIVTTAATPVSPSFPKKLLILGLSVLLGLGLGLRGWRCWSTISIGA